MATPATPSVNVRIWRPEDLPFLRMFAFLNAWQILPEGDRLKASIGAVAQNAESNLLSVLTSPGGTAVVADHEGTPVGYLLVGVRQDENTGDPVGYLADIYLEPPYRKLGLGGRFHEMGEQHLAKVGVGRATLWTHAHNPLGQGSALKRGYKFQAVAMSKELQR